MNWDAVGAIAELAGAVGVIASLIYLARQIRQSNATDKLTATLGIQASYNDVARFFLEDEDDALAGLEDFSKLDEGERFKLAAKLHTLYSHFELVYSHHQKGLIDRDLVKRTYSLLYWYRGRKGVQKWWERIGRGQFSGEFVAFVEGPEVTE
jgi:hypothetical protein